MQAVATSSNSTFISTTPCSSLTDHLREMSLAVGSCEVRAHGLAHAFGVSQPQTPETAREQGSIPDEVAFMSRRVAQLSEILERVQVAVHGNDNMAKTDRRIA